MLARYPMPADDFANTAVPIPARLASSRPPNKPLAEIAGVPMIVQVWRCATEADIGPAERDDPNVVKAIIAFCPSGPQSGESTAADLGWALHLTRAAAPSGPGSAYHHIGIYAYRRHALERFAGLPPSPLERRERLEQLRALEHGMTIGVVRVDTVPLGVDTPDQLEEERRLLD